MIKQHDLLIVTAVTLLAAFSGASVDGAISFDFEDGTAQGWTNVYTSTFPNGPTQFIVQDPPNDNTGGGANGSPIPIGNFMVAVDPFNIPGFGGTRDFQHETLIFRSPEFTFDGFGNGDLTFQTIGGADAGSFGLPPLNVPGNFPTTNFGNLGVALRRVATDEYVWYEGRSFNSQFSWSTHTWTEGLISGYFGGGPWTLDLIDTYHGGWGWSGLDEVFIPGTLVPESSSGPMLGLAMVLSAIACRRLHRRQR